MTRPFLIALAAVSLLCPPALAETKVVKRTFSNGTGFFVTDDGYVVTNNHVIDRCQDHYTVYASGALPKTKAKLIARDTVNDLALLKAQAPAPDSARFHPDTVPVDTGDRVMVLGYPGQKWEVGDPVSHRSKVISPSGPQGETHWMQFTDSVEEGNSGGPLMDMAGNVVGVIVAKAKLYVYESGSPMGMPRLKRSDIAISLPVVRQFLRQNGIRYQVADSTEALSEREVIGKASQFVVDVRCLISQQ